jgi:hypothetical protein
MFAKCIKIHDKFANHYTLGTVYKVQNNDMYEDCPILIRGDRNVHHSMSPGFFAEHFESIVPPAISDIIFKMAEDAKDSEDFESIAFLINSGIHEFGGFACYTAEDIKAEFNRRL